MLNSPLQPKTDYQSVTSDKGNTTPDYINFIELMTTVFNRHLDHCETLRNEFKTLCRERGVKTC